MKHFVCTEQSVAIVSKGNRSASHYTVKETLVVFLGSFPLRILAVFPSVEGSSHHFNSHDFTLLGISSEEQFLWQLHAHSHLSINRSDVDMSVGDQASSRQWGKELPPLIIKNKYRRHKRFYYTCHIWWRRLKMKLKSPPQNKQLCVCFKGILCCLT